MAGYGYAWVLAKLILNDLGISCWSYIPMVIGNWQCGKLNFPYPLLLIQTEDVMIRFSDVHQQSPEQGYIYQKGHSLLLWDVDKKVKVM